MGQNGYQVDLAALDEAAQGVQAAHDALASLLPGGMVGGHYATAGAAGDLLNELLLGEQDLGHAGLADAWKGFVNRRSWDLRTRLTEGEHMVSHLKDSRATYQKVEDAASGFLKGALEDGVAGNSAPDAANKSWGQVLQDIRPEWTKTSFYNGQQAMQTGHALQADGTSIVQDAQDPNGLVPKLTGTEGLLQEEQQLKPFEGR